MGFLDNLFGGKKENQSKRFTDSLRYDKGWLVQWEKILNTEISANSPFQLLTKELINNFKSYYFIAYKIGAENGNLSIYNGLSSKSKEILNSSHLDILIMELSQQAGNIDNPYIQKTLLGLFDIKINQLHKNEEANSINNLYHLVREIKEQANLVSRFYNHLNKIDIENKLFVLIQTYSVLNETVRNEVKNEWLKSVTAANKIVSNNELSFFETNDEILLFGNIKAAQYQAGNASKYSRALWNLLENNKHNPSLFLLYLYYLRLETNSSAANKKILSDWLKIIVIDKKLLQKILLIYESIDRNSYIFDLALLNRIIRKYLQDNDLDIEIYHNILSIFFDSPTQYKQTNDILLKKQNNLSNIAHKTVFPYLHTGIILPLSKEYKYHYSDFNTFQKELVLILSQITNAINTLEINYSGDFIISIGNEAVQNISNINQSLFKQNIPYQLIGFYHQKVFKNPRNRGQRIFMHVLVVNKEEYNLLLNYATNTQDIFLNYLFGDVNFAINNNYKKTVIQDSKVIKKIISENIGDQIFINDFRWRNVKIGIIDQFPNKKEWYEIMNHIISYTGSVKPSATWFKKLLKLTDTMSPEAFEIGMDRLLFDVLKNDIWFIKDHIKALRGMIWASTILNHSAACYYLEKLLLRSYKRNNNYGNPLSISGGSSCMSALVKLDTLESYNVLKKNYTNTDYERFKNQLKVYIEEFETKSNIPIERLLETKFDDFGFVNGEIIKKIDDHIFAKWSISENTILRNWIDEDGKKLAKAPKLLKSIAYEVNSTTAAIRYAISDFFHQIYEFNFSDISWEFEHFQNNYSQHPFISLLVDNLLWIAQLPNGKKTVFITQKQKNLNINNEEIFFDNNVLIKPYHSADIDDETHQTWFRYFAENQITPTFNYFYNFIDSPSELTDNLSHTLKKNLPADKHWRRINNAKPVSIRELKLLKKIVLAKIDENDKLALTFYNKPTKKSFNHIDLAHLKDPIAETAIRPKIKLELYNEIFNYYVNNSMTFNNLSKEILMKMAYFRHLDNFFKQLQTHFNNVSYKDFTIFIDGDLNKYQISLINRDQVNIFKADKTKKYLISMGVKPQKNYPALMGIPWKPDETIQRVLWAIEQLSNDTKVRFKTLKDRIN